MTTFNKYRVKGAYHYDWYETEDWYKYLVDRCVNFCKGSTIDIGCGDGLLANMIASTNRKFTVGIDPDEHGVALAKTRMDSPVDFRVEDVEDYNGISLEYMSCLNVIEHLDRPEVIKNFINKYVTKGAIITTIDYQGGALGEDHKFEWTYDEMMDFFKEFKPKGFRYKNTEWIGVEITK